jgi:polyadenylate-binding protein
MATTISSLITSPALHCRCRSLVSAAAPSYLSLRSIAAPRARSRAVALRVVASSAVLEAPEQVAARKLYVGNIPRTVTNNELRDMFAEHGTVERAEVINPARSLFSVVNSPAQRLHLSYFLDLPLPFLNNSV